MLIAATAAAALAWTPLPPASLPRSEVGAARGGRSIYVVGAFGAGGRTTAAVERYDIRRIWEALPDMQTARGGIASARLRDGRIVVFGGEDLSPGGSTIAGVELFDSRSRRWSTLPDMRTPRHGLGGAALGNRVFALKGGVTPGLSLSPTIEFLDVPAR